MSRLVWMLIICLIPMHAHAQSKPPQKIATVEGVVEYRLANGARLVLLPDASKPTITVNMTVLVGSRHEGYGESGMAHLLEHMVFKGTPTFPDVPTSLRDHGASFNGTTNRDRTNYYETLPATAENLEFAIQLESDRLVNSFVRAEDLMSEFTVVRNEFERGENSPQSVLYRRVMAAAYEWHNYGKTTIGNRSDIERVPIYNLRAFYQKYYQPDNVVLIVSGRFDESQALEFANKYLGSIPTPTRELPRTYTVEPPQDGERLVELRRVGKVGSLLAAYHMPAAAHEDWAPLSILASVISEDQVGLLEQRLVETKLATSASARADNAHDPGLFTFSVQPVEGKLEEAQTALLHVLDTLGEQPLDADAIERAKTRARRSFERLQVDAARMASALSSASSLGDWRLLFIQRDRLQQVSLADVKRVAEKYFAPHNRTVGVFLPTDEPRRAEIPEVASIDELVEGYRGGETMQAGEAFDPSPENLESRLVTVELNGLRVGLVPKQNRGETVNLTLTLRYGNAESLRDQALAAGLLPSMLMSGTKSLDRQALQAKMAELGVRISPGFGGRRGRGSGGSAGELTFSIQAKRDSLIPAIELLGEILRQPAFPERDFAQMKARMDVMSQRLLTDPQSLARTKLSRALSKYEPGDVRYIPTIDESLEQIEQLTLSQIQSIYRQQLAAAAGEIAVVGDFDRESTLDALRRITDDWNSSVAHQPIYREAKQDLQGATKSINTPDKANAVFTAGLVFPLSDTNDDTEALLLGNFIFGGSTLSSRLGDRIRQKEGLSYGATSSMSIPSEGDDARFRISAITNPANIEAVEAAALEELQRFLDDGPTEKEVADAITAWLERRKVSRSNDSSIARQIAENLQLDRSFAFIAEREKRVEQLTPAAIQAAFRKHLDPRKLVIVRAGDFSDRK